MKSFGEFTVGVKSISGPATALFPPLDDRSSWDCYLTRELTAAIERAAAGAVIPTLDFVKFRHQLAGFDFGAPRPVDELFSWVVGLMEAGVVHVTHPRYFGLFNPGPTFPAQCADRITAAFNPQLATATTSPAAVEIEAHVIRSVADRAGLPVGTTGHFTTGGAEANYTALICALTRSDPQFAEQGARALKGPPIFYISRESHLAWFKIAHQAGIGRSAVRLIATDGTGRLDPNSLVDTIEADRFKGFVPFMIAATAGTTNAGMIDPLVECGNIAQTFGLWYHVDAAWGGALIASAALRDQLSGIEKADSLTIDAHKWFAATMGCGMFFTRHPEVLSTTFHVSAGYMPSSDLRSDPYLTSMQWSRRFLGLRLFMSLAAAGWAGYAQHVERAIDLIALLRQALSAREWLILNRSALAVLCFMPANGVRSISSIVRRVLVSGRAWVSAAEFEGHQVIRVCVTNGQTMAEDIWELVNALEAARYDQTGVEPTTAV